MKNRLKPTEIKIEKVIIHAVELKTKKSIALVLSKNQFLKWVKMLNKAPTTNRKV